MTKKFTKGEWEISDSNHVKCDGKAIAYAFSMNVGDEEAKANAKLIAAATDMFAALERIYNDKEVWSDIDDEQRNAIENALNKATE